MCSDGASGMIGASEFSLSPCVNCGNKSTLCCANCRKEYFCSDICQKARQQHKLICFPAKEEIGFSLRTRRWENKPKRFWAATRDIKEGEEIFTDYPLLTGPGEMESVPGRHICLGCHMILENFDAETDERKCGDCRWPICGDACPRNDRRHNECATLLQMKLKEPETSKFEYFATRAGVDAVYGIIRVVRVLDLVKDDKIKCQSFLNLNVPDYAHLIPKAKGAVELFKSGGQVDHLSEDTILGLISATVNRRRSPYYPKIDIAELLIYEKETRMDISCIGNCYVSQIPKLNDMKDPHGIAITAAQYIRKGERLSITFGGNPMWDGTRRRRETQMNNKPGDIGFVCKCARCSDPTELGSNVSAIECTKCKSGLLLPLEENSKWTCNTPGCKHVLPAFDADKVVRKAQMEADDLLQSHTTTLSDGRISINSNLIDSATKFVEKYEKILNPHHYILLNLQDLTANLSTFRIHKIIRPDKPFSPALSQRIDEHRRIAEILVHIANKIFPPLSNPFLEAHFYVGMSNFFSAQQAVQNEATTDVVQDWLKQGVSKRRYVTEIEIKLSLTMPSEKNAKDQFLDKYLGEAYENALELCRLTSNYSGIPEKMVEFDQNPATAAVPTVAVEEN